MTARGLRGHDDMADRGKSVIRSRNRTKKRLLVTKWKVGDLIRDRYEVYDVKAGGIGIVYIVYDYENEIPYAIKTLQNRHFSNPMATRRFAQEAEVWIRLGHHRNIVHAIWVDQIEDRPYIFLECVIGSSLRAALSGGPLALRTALSYGIQFCRGMIHAQEKIPTFAHLDIKPENCLLTQDNTLKVTDFSLARTLLEPGRVFGDRLRTGVGSPLKGVSVAGTLPYMAPEQFVDFGRAGMRSDIYAFGVVLFEMLTGKRPFFAETASEWRDAHRAITPLQPRALDSSISGELSDLTMECLAKNPAERPKDFAAIMNRLEAMLWEKFHEEIPPSTSVQLERWEYSNMGVSLYNLGRIREAISYFDKALFTDSEDAQALLNKGVALGALGKAVEEIECYEKALAIDPEYAAAWYNKGLALHKLGDFEDAVSCYDRALAIDPHQADVWVNRGSALGSLGRFGQETSCYEKAIAIEPNHVRAWIGKAAASMNLGSFDEADACCDRALAINSGMAEAWVNKASALGALERFGEAIRCCEKALAIDPRLCEAWLCKGLALGSLGRLKEEACCYERALTVNPNHPEAWYRKGLTLNSLGRFEEAVSCFEEALKINPKHAEAWLNKGLALRTLGRGPEGDRCLQKASAIDPSITEANK